MAAENHRRSLGELFVRTARKNWQRRCICDCTGKSLSYGQALVSAAAVGAEITKQTHGQEKIGILLPASGAGALANLGLTLEGKVAVNLNYSLSEALVKSAINECGIESIISSRSFIEKLGILKFFKGFLFFEDIVKKVTAAARIKAYLKAWLLPAGRLANNRLRCGKDLATVIFSSGSSGKPKGVMLSHDNIISNIESVLRVFKLIPQDNLCAVLPFFHSFGYTCSLWLPVVAGISASYVNNPLDGELAGRTACKNDSTIIFTTPTMLSYYIRRTAQEAFGGLRAVIVGAEALRKSLSDGFEEKFGIRPSEGYGTSELSPVVSLNVPAQLSCDASASGSKEGTVGMPIPGVSVKIVDIRDGRETVIGKPGLLLVKGPNVMLGYLNRDKETRKVVNNGWYNTGDIASIDQEGFLTIKDRLERFSKIAGEMVPHKGVEEAFLQGLNTNEAVVAVTAVPDSRKGEELVVLYLDKAGDADKLHEIVTNSALPNLWKPRRNNYIKVKSLPVSGSGKLNVMELKKMALSGNVKSSIR